MKWQWPAHRDPRRTGHSQWKAETLPGEVVSELGQVRVTEAGASVEGLARRAGVVQVVVAGTAGAHRGERVVARGREPVDLRVPQTDPVADVLVDERVGAVQLRRHEAGTAPAGLQRGG